MSDYVNLCVYDSLQKTWHHILVEFSHFTPTVPRVASGSTAIMIRITWSLNVNDVFWPELFWILSAQDWFWFKWRINLCMHSTLHVCCLLLMVADCSMNGYFPSKASSMSSDWLGSCSTWLSIFMRRRGCIVNKEERGFLWKLALVIEKNHLNTCELKKDVQTSTNKSKLIFYDCFFCICAYVCTDKYSLLHSHILRNFYIPILPP